MSEFRFGFIGAGRLASALVLALVRAGETSIALASRQIESAARLRALCGNPPAMRIFAAAQELADACDLVFLSVPDDTIQATAASVRWRGGQAVVHCSGATEVAALAAAADAGASIGGFHPLQIFSDPVLAQEYLAGSSVAIEGEGVLAADLLQLAARLGLQPLHLPGGARMAYHAAANLAASGLLSVLKEAEDIWAASGLPRKSALAALMPLAQGTLAGAQQNGLARAVAGPVSRADLKVLNGHFHAVQRMTGSAGFYAEVIKRLALLAHSAGRLNAGQVQAIDKMLSEFLPEPGEGTS